MTGEICNCTTATEYPSKQWKCTCGRRRFIPIEICCQCDEAKAEKQLPVLAPDKPKVVGPIGGHAKNDVDCCGVSIELLLTGIESDCPECEAELCDIRDFPTSKDVA